MSSHQTGDCEADRNVLSRVSVLGFWYCGAVAKVPIPRGDAAGGGIGEATFKAAVPVVGAAVKLATGAGAATVM